MAAVDATADGGDLLERGYGEDVPAGEWVFSEGVLWGRRALGSPDGESLAAASTHALLGAAGYLPIYDAGSTLRARRLAPLLVDRALAIVLVVASRGDSVNRLPGQLEWIQSTLGEEALARSSSWLLRPDPAKRPWQHLRAHLGNRVGAICEISHEASLASGGPVRWNELSEQIQGDFEQLAKTVRNVGDAWVARP
ncbi:hypothetical protein GS471_30100 [Rhodococcus hoagii]|nr:hypothetical protein [Prescottella equi]